MKYMEIHAVYDKALEDRRPTVATIPICFVFCVAVYVPFLTVCGCTVGCNVRPYARTQYLPAAPASSRAHFVHNRTGGVSVFFPTHFEELNVFVHRVWRGSNLKRPRIDSCCFPNRSEIRYVTADKKTIAMTASVSTRAPAIGRACKVSWVTRLLTDVRV